MNMTESNKFAFLLSVEQAGFEPAVLLASDLQSGGVTNFPTTPFKMEEMKGFEPLVGFTPRWFSKPVP